MNTKRWEITSLNQNFTRVIEEAARLLMEGEVVAFPTETVYGLGADAKNDAAVRKIFKAKQRPVDNPLIAHVSSKEMLAELVTEIPDYVKRLIEQYTPGPLTFVLKSNGTCAESVTAGLDTVAVRMPDHPVALALIDKLQGPIAAPSANLSGRPSPVTADHVWRDLSGAIAGLIDAGSTGIGVESTVIDCTKEIPNILRLGAITEEAMREVIGEVNFDESVKTRSNQYKHYKPDVPLWVVNLSLEETQDLIEQKRKEGFRVGVLGKNEFVSQLSSDDHFYLGDTLEEVARNLFSGFRYFTKEKVDIVLCQSFPNKGLGKTVMNRIEKAASRII